MSQPFEPAIGAGVYELYPIPCVKKRAKKDGASTREAVSPRIDAFLINPDMIKQCVHISKYIQVLWVCQEKYIQFYALLIDPEISASS